MSVSVVPSWSETTVTQEQLRRGQPHHRPGSLLLHLRPRLGGGAHHRRCGEYHITVLIFDLVRLLGVFHISPWFHTYQQSPSPYPMLLCQARYSTCGAATRRASTSRAAAWRPPPSASPCRRCWAPAAALATPSPWRRRWSRRRGGAMMGSQVCCNMHDSCIQNK